MLTRKSILSMTTAAALCAAPVLAFGQQNTGGSSQMPTATQTTPQQGTVSGNPAARGAATTGSDTGRAPNTSGASSEGGTNAPHTMNPSGAATGQSLSTSGGRAAAPGAPSDARGGASAQNNNAPDGTPGNPPSTATQRAADSVTGNRTEADGTGNNPPGTAAGRAMDRATSGTDTRGGAPGPNATGNAGTNRGSGTAATGATTPGMAVDSMQLREGQRASRLIGSTVYNENNESIGEVDDLIVPQAGGQPVAVISVGGFLGIGARLVAVPYERLQHNAERNRWMLQGATRDSLQSLPAFNYGDSNRRG